MIRFQKLFKLPGPVELGMSDNDHAMASELFRNKPDEYTWEMYYDKLKELYPVRFFLTSTMPQFFRDCWLNVSRPFTDAIYWLKCHCLTKHKYHLVDIRKAANVGSVVPYTHGWMDTDGRMIFAMFSLLIDFVEKEMPNSYFIPSEEDAAKDDGTCNDYAGYKAQLDRHKEYMAIYNYWMVEHPAEEEMGSELTHTWYELHKAAQGLDTDEVKAAWKATRDAEAAREAKLEEMLVRLLKIRHCLWT